MSFFSFFHRGFNAGKGLLAGLPQDIDERDPVMLFEEWFGAAKKSGIALADAMCLATCTTDGRPSARMVLLKEIEARAVVFYTNYDSRKAAELAANPRAAAVIHWTALQRQVRIEGPVARVSHKQSQRYFHSRDRGSQIGAWASRQSQPLADRQELERRDRQMRDRYRDHEVPLPEFWGGFRIGIECIEFWQGRANRLHDRMRFDWDADTWRRERLYP